MAVKRPREAALRVAVVSLHTSPLDQPGTGDAGGLNVYVARTAERMAAVGAQVDVFTRATSAHRPSVVATRPGVRVHHLAAGPLEGLPKEDLPGQVCAFTSQLLRAGRILPRFDVVHSHYWLSGQAGWLAAERWSVPLVHTMHTMARVKNASLAAGDLPEPRMRILGEEQLIGVADRFIANTSDEAEDLISHYGADPDTVRVIHPGVDLSVFRPGDRQAARARLGIPRGDQVLLFVGRVQPLKAPDLLLRAAARMVRDDPRLGESLSVVICGGPSGRLERPEHLVELARSLGIGGLVRFEPPTDPATLASWYRAADLVVVPSHSESFGLVAVEAQACGTPVLAARVGGLRTAVADGEGGILIDGHDEADWAEHMARLLADPWRLEAMSYRAIAHARRFSWAATAGATLAEYERVIATRHQGRLGVAN